MNAMQRQAAANPWTKPTDLGGDSACRLLMSIPTIAGISYVTNTPDYLCYFYSI